MPSYVRMERLVGRCCPLEAVGSRQSGSFNARADCVGMVEGLRKFKDFNE